MQLLSDDLPKIYYFYVSLQDEYLYLALNDGRLVLELGTSTESYLLEPRNRYNDGKWVKISIRQNENTGNKMENRYQPDPFILFLIFNQLAFLNPWSFQKSVSSLFHYCYQHFLFTVLITILTRFLYIGILSVINLGGILETLNTALPLSIYTPNNYIFVGGFPPDQLIK